jgi:hypothetical protein
MAIKATQVAPAQSAPGAFRPRKRGRRVLIYGEGGVGKTTLATKLNGKTLFFDLEGSLDDLFDELPPNIVKVEPADWEEMERFLSSKNVLNYDNVVVDSLTALETMFWRYIATHCRKAKEGYGMVTFSDQPMQPLKDEKELGGGGADSAKYAMWTRFEGFISALTAEGLNFVDLCHDCVKEKDDPSDGIDVKHQPRLNDPNSGKNSIRARAAEVHGEVWFIKWEVLRKDERHVVKTGRRIVLGQPDEEHAADFVGVMSKSRRGFSTAYLDEFDINSVLGITPSVPSAPTSEEIPAPPAE